MPVLPILRVAVFLRTRPFPSEFVWFDHPAPRFPPLGWRHRPRHPPIQPRHPSKPNPIKTVFESKSLGGHHGSHEIDSWKLKLDGTGRDFTRLTHFTFQVARTADEARVGYGLVLMTLPR